MTTTMMRMEEENKKRLEQETNEKMKSNTQRNLVIVAGSVIAICAFVGGIWYWRYQRNRKQKEENKKEPITTTYSVPLVVVNHESPQLQFDSAEGVSEGNYKGHVLSMNVPFKVGDWIASDNGEYIMVQESNGQLSIAEIHSGSSQGAKVIWQSRTLGPSSPHYFSVLLDNGQLTTYQSNGTSSDVSLWWSGGIDVDVPDPTALSLRLTDHGLLVVRYNDGTMRFSKMILGIQPDFTRYIRVPSSLFDASFG